MAPPSSRRPGFSRRAQYGLFLGYVVAVAGMIVAVLLLAIAIVDPRGFAAIKGAALDATTPVSSGARGVTRFFGGIGSGIGNYFRAGSQNARLRRELAETRRELIHVQAAAAENRRLTRLLGLAQEVGDEITVARIVGSSFESPRRLATLSAGRAAGVEVGQPVRSPDGLIGRVIETGRWAARVLLVTDGSSNVPVRLVRNGTPAIAVGRGDGTVELRTLEVGENPFRRGDVLVTSGVGGIFPPGVPVARVVRIEGDTAIAQPLADPARVDFAIVQRAYQPAAGADLEAAPPQPVAPPVPAPPPGSEPAGPGLTTPAPRQRDPRYQPALQQPQPGATLPPR
ncbi:MAG TPA: rod shape-determining protein MreC [Allosphingosinicella sp.]|jgi:rod shape-determining protein MreC|nr:rod shape-determining protein MreC [Allosphingosinicella sp.]